MAYSVTENVVHTITLASVANNAFADGNAIDNSTDLYWEALVQVRLHTATSGTSATGFCNVYLRRSVDGTDWDLNNMVMIGTVPMIANNTSYYASFSTLPFGALGNDWRISIENRTGAALHATAGNHKVEHSGIKYA